MCVKLHIDKKFFKVFKAMGKHQSKAKRNLITKLANETHFTEEEIRQWYKGFFADCPNGRLSQKSFLKIYQQFFPEGDSTKFAKSVFRVFDENKDGLIEFEEFIKSLSITSRGSLDEKLQWSFKLYDENSDGYVTKAEIFAILDYIQLMIQPSQKTAQSNDHQKSSDKSNSFVDKNANDPPNTDTPTDKEQFKDRQTNSKTNGSGQTNGNSASNPTSNPTSNPPSKSPKNSVKSQTNGSGNQTNGQLNNQNSIDSGQQATREANGETMGNGEMKKEDNRANDTNTEESNGSIAMEPNQILDIKQCKEKIEQIFQKIDKNSITLEQFLQLSKTDPELCKAFYLYNLT